MPSLPRADTLHPLVFPDGTVHRQMVNLAVAVDHPNWEVGRHAYANDFDPPEDWASRLAPYLYPGAPERLSIGPFCQIANGARFVTASANHPMQGISTYPFPVFDPESLPLYKASFANLPDTVIGPDCWIGHGAIILPGARLGAGVIVGAGAVVRGKIPAYAIVAGSGLDYTVVRPPMLADEPGGVDLHGSYTPPKPIPVGRGDLARFLLDAAVEGEFVRESPLVSYRERAK